MIVTPAYLHLFKKRREKKKERRIFFAFFCRAAFLLFVCLGGEQLSEVASHACCLCSGQNYEFVLIINISLDKFWSLENANLQ